MALWRSQVGARRAVWRVAEVRGAAETKKRENDVHLRQLAKKSTYVPLFCLVRFWALLGSRQGEFENTRKKIEYVSKKKHRGNIFSGGRIFFWVIFF
jgi:hypothetical protein